MPYLKPLTKDDRERRPNKLMGIAPLAKRLREEAEEDEYKKGMEDEAKTEEEKKDTGMDVDGSEVKVKKEKKEDGAEVAGAGDAADAKDKKKAKGKRKTFSINGVIGQEAVKMRREAIKRRQEEYKKNAEKNCESTVVVV